MLLRKNILPKRMTDAIATLFFMFMIPVVFYFEVFVVVPTFFAPWSFSYIFHVSLGTYILWNVAGNYMALQLCNSSIKGRVLPSVPKGINWKLCSVCECVTPPRSWHCETCNICILRRDHHCKFISYCVGHFNFRYFYMLVFYLFIGTTYASILNAMYLYSTVSFDFSFNTFLKVVFPFAVFFMTYSTQQGYVVICFIVLAAAIFSGVLVYYHGYNQLMLARTTKERDVKMHVYDRGTLNNIRDLMGDRWYLTWLSPYIVSELPQDGINWATNDSLKNE